MKKIRLMVAFFSIPLTYVYGQIITDIQPEAIFPNVSKNFTSDDSSYFAKCSELLKPLLVHELSKKKIILASSSPRRKRLLDRIGLKYEIIPSKFDESSLNVSSYEDKKAYALDIAKQKVAHVFDNLNKSNTLPDLIIGADTIVELSNRVLGKPKDKNEAIEFLKMLSGRLHFVHTAVVIRTLTKSKNFVETSTVHMEPLNIDVIKRYVNTGRPLDKAGAYGIQELDGTLVKKVDDYYNAIGFPLYQFCVNLVNLFKS